MAMGVDKTRRNNHTRGIDIDAAPQRRELTDIGDTVAAYKNIRPIPGISRSIRNPAVSYYRINHRPFPLKNRLQQYNPGLVDCLQFHNRIDIRLNPPLQYGWKHTKSWNVFME
jgi:hypothetical protein